MEQGLAGHGANSGFGRAITEAAVPAGGIVVAAARRVETLDDLVAAHPDQVDALRLDVTGTAGIEAAVSDVTERHGRIDLLVNNVGRTHIGAFEGTTDAELRSLFDVHVFGPAALVRAVLPGMRARRSGAIVQLSSMGGQMSFAGFSAYSGTKFALEGMTEALIDGVRPLGIKALIVEPGAFRVSLMANGSASSELPDYEATVGATRKTSADANGVQPGDPAKAAALVIEALAADETPLHLPLGEDGVSAVLDHLDQVRAQITPWETRARNTAFDGAGGGGADAAEVGGA